MLRFQEVRMRIENILIFCLNTACAPGHQELGTGLLKHIEIWL